MELLLTKDLPVASAGALARPSATEVYREHADFVWRSLQHLGIPDADLPDVTQEVFVVVYRKLHTFDGSSRMTTWLFGICLRAASRHRRRAYFRWERRTAELPERADPRTPEDGAIDRERQRLLQAALARLSLTQRAVFVLFELEGQPCGAIAEVLGVPIGTVHSRLHQARKSVQKSLRKARVLRGAT